MIEIVITQDDSGRWYIIPKEIYPEYSEMEVQLIYNDYDPVIFQEMEQKFGKYMVDGDPNYYKLFIAEDEMTKLTGNGKLVTK